MNVQNTSCINSLFFKTILGFGTLITIGAIAASIIGLSASPQGPFNVLVQLGKGINGTLCGVSLFAFILELVGFSRVCRKNEEKIAEPQFEEIFPEVSRPVKLKSPVVQVPPVEKKDTKIEPPIPKQTHLPPETEKLTAMEKAKEAFIENANKLASEKMGSKETLELKLDKTHEASIKQAAAELDYSYPNVRGGHNFLIFELKEYPGIIFKKSRHDGEFSEYVKAAETVSALCLKHQLNLFKIPKYEVLKFEDFEILAEEKIETNAVGPINCENALDPTQSHVEIFKWIYSQEKLIKYQDALGQQITKLLYYANFDSFNFTSFIVTNEGQVALVNLDSLSSGSLRGYQESWFSFLEIFSKMTHDVYPRIFLNTVYSCIKKEDARTPVLDKLWKKKEELSREPKESSDVRKWMSDRDIKHPAQPIDLNVERLHIVDSDVVYKADPETKRVAAFLVKKINEKLESKTHWELVSQRTLWFDWHAIESFAGELYPNDPESRKKIWSTLGHTLCSLQQPGYIFKYAVDGHFKHMTIIC